MARRYADPALAANLMTLMRDADMSASDVSRAACAAGEPITSTAVSYTMSGTHLPTLRTLRAIKAALGCTWDQLLGP